MPYSVVSEKSGHTYFLHSRENESIRGRRVLFFFARDIKTADGAMPLEALPEGYTVIESSQTGLPMLKRAERSPE